MRSTLPFAAIVALAATAAITGTASASPIQSFHAHNYDACLSSYTNGELTWRTSTTTRPTAVDVTGYVGLRDPHQCAFPSRPTAVAVFTAYNGGTVVDTQRESTLTGSADFRFVLASPSASPVIVPIDRVTVQVCHTAPVTAPTAVTCGDISTYTP
ncbi:MAG TPA: hypothetical protein VM677_33460 [Actinokineospora sp.]|jgi:hypothetical protein|nr:hypothetical protein [Actinokineospora sp.]